MRTLPIPLLMQIRRLHMDSKDSKIKQGTSPHGWLDVEDSFHADLVVAYSIRIDSYNRYNDMAVKKMALNVKIAKEIFHGRGG